MNSTSNNDINIHYNLNTNNSNKNQHKIGASSLSSSPSSSMLQQVRHVTSFSANNNNNKSKWCYRTRTRPNLLHNTQQYFAAVRNFSSSEQKRDLYEVLGVSRSADKGTIKKAYFKLAKEYHPDRNKGDKNAADKFKEATAAYEVLSDDKQRELYNNFGHAGIDPNSGFGEEGGGGNPFGGFGGGGFNFNDGSFHVHSSSSDGSIDPEELFEAFFGGGGRRRNKPRGPRNGADLQMHVRLSFKEAVFGIKKDLHLKYQTRDSKNSNRMVTKERDVTVDIPAGIDTGMNLRLAGKGAEGEPGAQNGNLFVQILVDDDPYFKREGLDVHTDVAISFVQAVLGGTVDVKTLTGTVEMKVPKGTQLGTKLLLRNKGIPMLNNPSTTRKGNHIVHLQIEIPKKINHKQELLLRQFDEESQLCGLGLSGRIAKAAGSAFESIFGSGKKEKKKNDDNDKKKDSNSNRKNQTKNDNVDDHDKEDDFEEKKQQAQ